MCSHTDANSPDRGRPGVANASQSSSDAGELLQNRDAEMLIIRHLHDAAHQASHTAKSSLHGPGDIIILPIECETRHDIDMLPTAMRTEGSGDNNQPLRRLRGRS